MALSEGDKLGPYQVVARIGAGGMGELYRAGDPRIGAGIEIKARDISKVGLKIVGQNAVLAVMALTAAQSRNAVPKARGPDDGFR